MSYIITVVNKSITPTQIEPNIKNNVLDLPYRQSVYAYILNNENKILLVHKKNSNTWDFPGGGIDQNETLEEAIKREVLEELSIDHFDILHKVSFTYKYDWPESEVEKHYKKTGLKRRGQEQSHFILRFTGCDDDIKLQDEELHEFKWFSGKELKNLMNYRDQYDSVVKAFKEFSNPNIFDL